MTVGSRWIRLIQSAAFAAAAFGAETIPAPSGVTAHEWGTFTSIAGRDGAPLRWYALGGPSKLPCFVHKSDLITKSSAFTTVRMETPVIYFYSPRQATLSVKVSMRNGSLTEFYPDARHVTSNQLEWSGIQVLPGEKLAFPSGGEGNHYYAARATDAAPLRVGDEQEKLIFYRGVGEMDIAIRPRYLPNGKIEVRNLSANSIPAAFVFESRDGKIGYRAWHDLLGTATIEAPELTGNIDELRTMLGNDLVRAGLFPKEAQAMLDTWRDSWFEAGVRVIYVLPRDAVDGVLPLTITPAAAQTARVFVGRIEMMSPAMAEDIETVVKNRDRAGAGKYGRFLQAFWEALHGTGANLPTGLMAASTGGCAQ